MGLLRFVVERPTGEPAPGLAVTLHSEDVAEPGALESGRATTDEEGVARFWVHPGTYRVRFQAMPEGMTPPRYGTRATLGESTEGIERVIRLVRTHSYPPA